MKTAFSWRTAVRLRIFVSLTLFLIMSVLFFTALPISGETALSESLFYRVQFFPALLRVLALGSGGAAAAVLFTVILTLIFGRAYCSSLCPLGTLQDLVFHFSPGRKRNVFRGKQKIRNIIRGGILLTAAAGFFSGLSLISGSVEPFSIYARLITDFIRPLLNRGLNLLIPVFESGGVYLGTEPVPFRTAAAAFALVLAGITAGTAIFRGRWFCSTVCPAGSVLALLASKSLFRIRLDLHSCTQCGACERICKAGCLRPSTGTIISGDCVLCFSCLSACRFQALTYTFRHPVGEYLPERTIKAGPHGREKYLSRGEDQQVECRL